MAIHKSNLRYQLQTLLFISLIWIISINLLLLNRFMGPEFLQGNRTWILSGTEFGKLFLWSVFSGLFLGLTTGIFEYFFSLRTFSRLRGIHLILLKTFSYLGFFVLLTILTYFIFLDQLSLPGLPDSYTSFLLSESTIATMVHLVFSSAIVNAFIYTQRILGPFKFAKILTGQYHHPQNEYLIFMFLDLKDSTRLAESWGQKKTARFFQQYFGDLSELILPYKGNLYQYVGDEAVVTWKIQEDSDNLECIRFFYAFKKSMEDKKELYLSRFDIVPEFKAGIHCGNVTISEIGKYRIDLAYHGDVLNTTSRITGQCRVLGKDLLISRTLYDHLELTGYNYENVGEAQLRGKEAYTNLYYVYPKDVE